MAKLIIKLINGVADVVNRDPDGRGIGSRSVFLPDFNVKLGQRIYPAADLSEQISTAGKEASGTGNMKFAMNGALTIGTLDGANIEIREAVGAENFFLFGLTAERGGPSARRNGYRPRDDLRGERRAARGRIDLIGSRAPSRDGDRELFRAARRLAADRDDYMLLADYQATSTASSARATPIGTSDNWTRMSILNTARTGRFSSDRAIREYCRDIWHIDPASRPASGR